MSYFLYSNTQHDQGGVHAADCADHEERHLHCVPLTGSWSRRPLLGRIWGEEHLLIIVLEFFDHLQKVNHLDIAPLYAPILMGISNTVRNQLPRIF